MAQTPAIHLLSHDLLIQQCPPLKTNQEAAEWNVCHQGYNDCADVDQLSFQVAHDLIDDLL